MAMPVTVPRYTLDDLALFPDDGNRYELLDGVLLVTPAPGLPHELVVLRIHGALTAYLGAQALVFTRGVVQLPPRNHLEPDLLVLPATVPVARRRWADLRGFWLAVEVSGRGSRVYDRDFKHAAYPSLGVAEAWRADLRERSIDVSRPGEPVLTLRDRLEWGAPGFSTSLALDIGAVFEGIEDDE
jgi:Uma2 family endonuclease